MNGYKEFLEGKIKLAERTGFTVDESSINEILFPHQKDTVRWALDGGRRAVFASFGLGKTLIQIEIGKAVVKQTGKPFLIGLPLGVKGEFLLDAEKLDVPVCYVKDMDEAKSAVNDGVFIHLCNYERIREGKLDPDYYGGCSFDEASIIRNLDTDTSDYILNHFISIIYRFVCTATPSPNEYTEILNYAHFLGIMDRGQALTRFFQRDSTKAGNLTLYPHKEREFWMWVSSWALFITKPSDLGYSDEGYELPELDVVYHKVTVKQREPIVDRDGSQKLFRNAAASLQDAAKEKRESMPFRISQMKKIINQSQIGTSFLIWHHLEDERKAIAKVLPGVVSVYGSQDREEREEYLMGFGRGRYQYLSTKPEIAGQGCNFQRFCSDMIFVGIDYKFNDFIQAIHRVYRFLQLRKVTVHIIYTESEEQILTKLQEKWARHNDMVQQMTDIIKTYGLNHSNLRADLERSMGVTRKESVGKNYLCILNDNVLELEKWDSNSVGMQLTSIPFGDQYEYCESYHDMGHNFGNEEFFKQMDFLTPHVFRVLMPGRILCVHVKDRIRYSYQNGVGFTSLEDFSGQTVSHYVKHGFHLMGKITVTTDVVQENNQTYRLGWSEQCKDGSKMGVGLPEYILIFRKPPTDKSNAYADVPVVKTKEDYTRAKWQLDAHALWGSNGNRLISIEDMAEMDDLSRVAAVWKAYSAQAPYEFSEHLRACEALDKKNKLSSTFMTLPIHSKNDSVWTDVSRMHTLNSNQARKRQEKHVCPLQFDIVDRCIERYSNPGDVVMDFFGGIMTVPYRAIKLNRQGVGIELNEQYFTHGSKYCREAEELREVPTLFDII